MRIRTIAIWGTVVVTAGALVAAPSVYRHAAESWAGTTASARTAADQVPAADPYAVQDACPEMGPPYANCYAQYRISAQPLAGNAPSGWSPTDLRSAYALPATGGANQTVAVVIAYSNPNAEKDLAAYRSQFGLPECTTASGCLKIVNQAGAASPLPEPNQGWGLELMLDLDMVSAICPQCKLLVVQANSNSMEDLGTAVDTAAKLGANVISNSYGSNVEFASEADYEKHYNHPGVAVVASTGDIGYSVSFPAVSRYVTAVGGTTLKKSSTGAWQETVWSGAGSGCSAYIPKPAWQDDPHCPMRMVADVAAVADPATGVAVYSTYGQGGWTVVGGTSAAAPIIAAVYALAGTTSKVNDGRTPWANRKGNFRDVTSGTNVPSAFAATCGGDYLCTGVAGYDGPTGWGTPQGVGGFKVN